MKKICAFDLEIAEPMEKEYSGQPISCAALFMDGNVEFAFDHPHMHQDDVIKFATRMQTLTETGYSLVGWNSCSFDWKVLAVQSGYTEACSRMCREHYDLMFEILCIKGFPLSLQASLKGMGLAGKKKEVTLKDGTVLDHMEGSQAPELWQKGEMDAVLTYLREDVAQIELLMQAIEANHFTLNWTSQKGRAQSLKFHDGFLTVQECLSIPKPDTSWMTSALRREDMISWMK